MESMTTHPCGVFGPCRVGRARGRSARHCGDHGTSWWLWPFTSAQPTRATCGGPGERSRYGGSGSAARCRRSAGRLVSGLRCSGGGTPDEAVGGTVMIRSVMARTNEATALSVIDRRGPGRVVVLVAGAPFAAACWSSLAGDLAEAGLHVVVYDKRGCGASSHPRAGHDHDTWAADLDEVLRELELRDVTLIGFSSGCGDVLRYIGRYGQGRVRAVVLISPVGVSPVTPDVGTPPHDLTRVSLQCPGGDHDVDLETFIAAAFSVDGRHVGGADQIDGVRRQAAAASEPAMRAVMTLLGPAARQLDTSRVTRPLLMLHGAGDSIAPVGSTAVPLAHAITHSEFVVVRDAPHALLATHEHVVRNWIHDLLERS